MLVPYSPVEVVDGKARYEGRTLAEWVPSLVDDLVRALDPIQIMLFGSVARGDDTKDSDVDLLIVVDQVVVWQQPLVAGQATGYLTGSSFVVSISGADSIVVLDGSGTESTKYGPEFTLP